MNVFKALSDARRQAGLTQVELAKRARTSQATLSAYESGAKVPSFPVLQRLLGATGCRLVVTELPGEASLSPERQEATSRGLGEVLALAEALPVRHEPRLAYPHLPESRS